LEKKVQLYLCSLGNFYRFLILSIFIRPFGGESLEPLLERSVNPPLVGPLDPLNPFKIINSFGDNLEIITIFKINVRRTF